MSKGLEVLDDVREQLISITAFVSAKNKELSVMYCLKENDDIKRYVDNVIGLKEIENELKRLEELEKAFDTLSKEDEKAKKLLSKEIEKNRAFEIIKNKNVNVDYLKVALSLDSLSYYNSLVGKERQLTQEEYDLLKEVLL